MAMKSAEFEIDSFPRFGQNAFKQLMADARSALSSLQFGPKSFSEFMTFFQLKKKETCRKHSVQFDGRHS